MPRLYFFSKGGIASFKTKEGGLIIPRGDAAFLVMQGLFDRYRLVTNSSNGVALGLSAFIVSIASTRSQEDGEAGDGKRQQIFHPASLAIRIKALNDWSGHAFFRDCWRVVGLRL